MAAVIRADRHERAPDHQALCNGHRPRTFDTLVGRLTLGIPTQREGVPSPPRSSSPAGGSNGLGGP